MRVVLIGLHEEANLLRGWLEPAGIEVEDPTEAAEKIAARCQVAIVDFARSGPAARLARDAWKHTSHIGVLVVLDDAADGVIALQAGADDFIVRPLDSAQLVARVLRVAAESAHKPAPRVVELEGILFDAADQTVNVGGEKLRLTTKTYALTQLFLRNVGRHLSRSEILTTVWGKRSDLNSRTLDAHVSQVRRALAKARAPALRLRSVYGHGYVLTREEGGTKPTPGAARRGWSGRRRA